MVNAKLTERKSVADTDIGRKLKQDVEALKLLLQAYKDGTIK